MNKNGEKSKEKPMSKSEIDSAQSEPKASKSATRTPSGSPQSGHTKPTGTQPQRQTQSSEKWVEIVRGGHRRFIRVGESADAMAEVAKLVTSCIYTMRHYGSRPPIEVVLPTFQALLADLPAIRVFSAFDQYQRSSCDMPTPYDIIALVEKMRQGGGTDSTTDAGQAEKNWWIGGGE